MDVAEYRQKYVETLKETSISQASFADLLDKSKSTKDRSTILLNRRVVVEASDVADIVNVLRDKDEAETLRIAALEAITVHVGRDSTLFDLLLTLLSDEQETLKLRLAIIRVLQVLSFSGPIFIAKRSEYYATLRTLVHEKNRELRHTVIEILAAAKDEYVQRLLLDSIKRRSQTMIGIAKAIQLLGYDIHSDYYSTLKEIIQAPPSRAAKIEAIRLLAADTSSKDLLLKILDDKTEHLEVRRVSAFALQTLAPTEFETYAQKIALDSEEDPALRATCLSGLTHFANPAIMTRDSAFYNDITKLHESTTAKSFKKATDKYKVKYGV